MSEIAIPLGTTFRVYYCPRCQIQTERAWHTCERAEPADPADGRRDALPRSCTRLPTTDRLRDPVEAPDGRDAAMTPPERSYSGIVGRWLRRHGEHVEDEEGCRS